MNSENNPYLHSIRILEHWLTGMSFEAYDPFDGLSSPLKHLTFGNKVAQQSLLQFVRRIPFNIRPLIGIKPSCSTKGMSFIGSGYLKLFQLTKDEYYKKQAEFCFEWLIKNYTKGYSGYCWGNSFDYASRGFYLPKGAPTLVWTALIGHHFIEAYRVLQHKEYKEVISSIGNFILNDLPRMEEDKGLCISYVTHEKVAVHNANLLGAGVLAEIYKLTGSLECKDLAAAAAAYSVNCQRDDGSWYYGEESKFHWIDNWHTAYNLDSLLTCQLQFGSNQFDASIKKGLDFYTKHFFREDGAPKYYWNREYKFDIQSASQSIDTLVLFSHYFHDKILFDLARKVADWTINNMQDPLGYFYLWKNNVCTNKTPTIHWGAGTMFHALASLMMEIHKNED